VPAAPEVDDQTRSNADCFPADYFVREIILVNQSLYLKRAWKRAHIVASLRFPEPPAGNRYEIVLPKPRQTFTKNCDFVTRLPQIGCGNP
jgi:hypothetical protein